MINSTKPIYDITSLDDTSGLKLPNNKSYTLKKSLILDLNIEQINPNDPDYRLVEEARKNRANGEKIHSLDDVMKEFNAN